MGKLNLKIIEYDFKAPYSFKDVSPSGVLEMSLAFGTAKGLLSMEERDYDGKGIKKETPRCLR